MKTGGISSGTIRLTSHSTNSSWRCLLGCPTTCLPRTVPVFESKSLTSQQTPQPRKTETSGHPVICPQRSYKHLSSPQGNEWVQIPSLSKPRSQTKMPQWLVANEQRQPGITLKGGVRQWQNKKRMILFKALKLTRILNILANSEKSAARLKIACLLPTLGLYLVLQDSSRKWKSE